MLIMAAGLLLALFAPFFGYPHRGARLAGVVATSVAAGLLGLVAFERVRAERGARIDWYSFDTSADGAGVLRVPPRPSRGARVSIGARSGRDVDVWRTVRAADVRVRFAGAELFPPSSRPAYVPPCGTEDAWTGQGCLVDDSHDFAAAEAIEIIYRVDATTRPSLDSLVLAVGPRFDDGEGIALARALSPILMAIAAALVGIGVVSTAVFLVRVRLDRRKG